MYRGTLGNAKNRAAVWARIAQRIPMAPPRHAVYARPGPAEFAYAHSPFAELPPPMTLLAPRRETMCAYERLDSEGAMKEGVSPAVRPQLAAHWLELARRLGASVHVADGKTTLAWLGRYWPWELAGTWDASVVTMIVEGETCRGFVMFSEFGTKIDVLVCPVDRLTEVFPKLWSAPPRLFWSRCLPQGVHLWSDKANLLGPTEVDAAITVAVRAVDAARHGAGYVRGWRHADLAIRLCSQCAIIVFTNGDCPACGAFAHYLDTGVQSLKGQALQHLPVLIATGAIGSILPIAGGGGDGDGGDGDDDGKRVDVGRVRKLGLFGTALRWGAPAVGLGVAYWLWRRSRARRRRYGQN